MNEVRRFFRYSLPGIACIVQYTIMLCLSDKQTVRDLMGHLPKENSLSGVVALFVTSGGLGYILANIYFPLFWRFHPVRHDKFLTTLVNGNIIKICDCDGKKLLKKDITPHRAWSILCQFWYAEKGQSPDIRNNNEWNDRLVDITHSLGSTIVRTILSMFLWSYFHDWAVTSRLPNIIYIGIWFTLIGVYICGYVKVHRAIQMNANSTVLNWLQKKRKEGHITTILIFFSD